MKQDLPGRGVQEQRWPLGMTQEEKNESRLRRETKASSALLKRYLLPFRLYSMVPIHSGATGRLQWVHPVPISKDRV